MAVESIKTADMPVDKVFVYRIEALGTREFMCNGGCGRLTKMYTRFGAIDNHFDDLCDRCLRGVRIQSPIYAHTIVECAWGTFDYTAYNDDAIDFCSLGPYAKILLRLNVTKAKI